jgi:hypothetical protein
MKKNLKKLSLKKQTVQVLKQDAKLGLNAGREAATQPQICFSNTCNPWCIKY